MRKITEKKANHQIFLIIIVFFARIDVRNQIYNFGNNRHYDKLKFSLS